MEDEFFKIEHGYAVCIWDLDTGTRVDEFFETLEEALEWRKVILTQHPCIYTARRISNRRGWPNVHFRLDACMDGWLSVTNQI